LTTDADELRDRRAGPFIQLEVLSAEPNSSSQDALNLLASWAATPEEVSTVPVEEDA